MVSGTVATVLRLDSPPASFLVDWKLWVGEYVILLWLRWLFGVYARGAQNTGGCKVSRESDTLLPVTPQLQINILIFGIDGLQSLGPRRCPSARFDFLQYNALGDCWVCSLARTTHICLFGFEHCCAIRGCDHRPHTRWKRHRYLRSV